VLGAYVKGAARVIACGRRHVGASSSGVGRAWTVSSTMPGLSPASDHSSALLSGKALTESVAESNLAQRRARASARTCPVGWEALMAGRTDSWRQWKAHPSASTASSSGPWAEVPQSTAADDLRYRPISSARDWLESQLILA